jgi:hypothetical protein
LSYASGYARCRVTSRTHVQAFLGRRGRVTADYRDLAGDTVAESAAARRTVDNGDTKVQASSALRVRIMTQQYGKNDYEIGVQTCLNVTTL